MIRTTPMPIPARLMVACVGPLIGVASGVVIGLFALLAAKLMKRGGAGTPAVQA